MRIHAWASGLFLAAIIVACGSESDSTFGDGNVDGGSSGSSGSLIPPVNTEGGTGPQVLGACGRTCADQGVKCGPAGDGCGGLIQCGTCNAPDTCGGGGKPSECGSGGTTCTPKTCADFPANSCGPLADGCGGLITCGGCTSPQICGGGGTASVCGGNDGCIPKATADCAGAGVQCGPMADGCGGSVDCGSCGVGQSCGAAGASKCGTAGGGSCTPKQCSDFGINCGPAGDGCGGLLDCGKCTAPQTCGGAGQPSKCGGNTGCVPKTCQQLGVSCGLAGDGCGGQIDCGPCVAPQTCGGGGTPSVCGGANNCVAKTTADCTAQGFDCGAIADGCGGTVQCGATCPNNGVCGATSPNKCSGGTTCTGLCLNQPTDCTGPNTPNTTTITGTVYMPNGKLPVSDALVYVPNGTVDAMPEGVQPGVCDQCSSQATGSPLVSTRTDFKGNFTLTNMPFVTTGTIPVVIQAGRWRKIIQITTNRCAPKSLGTAFPQPPTANNTTFGATQTATNSIPRYAVTSGTLDSLQCLLRKIGIADSEFGKYPSASRVHVYQGFGGTTAFQANFNGCAGGACTLDNEKVLYGNTNGGTAGVTDTGRIYKYDALVLSCTGDSYHAFIGPDQDLSNYVDEIRSYVDNGGKLFGSHWHHFWLEHGVAPFGVTTGGTPPDLAKIDNGGADLADPILANINTGFPKGATLADWLVYSHTLDGTTPQAHGVMKIGTGNNNVDDGAKHTIDTVDTARVNQWISIPSGTGANHTGNGNPSVQYFDFFTPIAASGQPTPSPQCGRFVNSDLHVASAVSNKGTFPTNNCGSSTAMTDQERVLAFMLFDLVSCIDQSNPTCTKKTCTNYPGTCGQQSDGCGGLTADCGTCTPPQTCGGGGTASVCGGTACVPRTCGQQNSTCGPTADGCGGVLDCGPCVAPQTCGGGGIPNQCGNPSCIPTTCAAQGITCGPAGDGCGGQLPCGDCVAPLICGGGGTPGVCGNAVCTKQTCQALGAECGPVGDGCGGLIPECGPCPPGQVCGGGGPSKCGVGSCTPRTCQQAGATCGPIGDGCGGQVDCGPCTQPGQTCGGGGSPNVCGGCTRTTCQAAGAECGPIGDGCGGEIDCGPCTRPGDTCGGGGTPFKCGQIGVK